MGLDGVEFVIAVEQAFGLAIPDADAQRLFTPGDVVRYLEARLGTGDRACLEQRAFHKLRRAAIRVLNRPRAAWRPETRWDDVLPSKQRRPTWTLLHHATGVVEWPYMPRWRSFPEQNATLGGTARFIATHGGAALLAEHEALSRVQIEQTIRRLMEECLAITEFEWTDRFVQDLGVD